MAKITPDKLGQEVEKILSEYGEEVERNINVIRKKVAQKGRTALKNVSDEKFHRTGTYAKSWTVTEEKMPHYTSAVIHNKKARLPHLLEHGHVIKAGGRAMGRVEGKVHIAPVEEELINLYVNEVVSKL